MVYFFILLLLFLWFSYRKVNDIAKMKSPKLIILDIDSLKSVNEYYGNYIGNFLNLFGPRHR